MIFNLYKVSTLRRNLDSGIGKCLFCTPQQTPMVEWVSQPLYQLKMYRLLNLFLDNDSILVWVQFNTQCIYLSNHRIMSRCQFLSGVMLVWIQSFVSLRLVALLHYDLPVAREKRTNGFMPFLKVLTQSEKQKQIHPRFELRSSIPFPMKMNTFVSRSWVFYLF